MPPSQIADADTSSAARPYGLLGLVLSLAGIAVLTIVFAGIAAGVTFGGLAARHGLQGALDVVASLGDALQSHSRLVMDRIGVVLGTGAYVADVAAILVFAVIRGGRAWRSLVAWRSWQPRRHWKLFVALFVLAITWEVGASIGIEHFHPEAKDWVVLPKETPWLTGFLVLAVLVGPFSEELLFRGWMYTSLRGSFGIVAAALVTSVLFALAHWESTHLYALAVFPVGLALVVIRERTGSIGASFMFHALYNGVASLLVVFDR